MVGNTCALVLAAGKGTRMRSELPKVLHELLGKPMLWYLLSTLERVKFKNKFLVVGHGREHLAEAFPREEENFVFQEYQQGTGHALQIAWERIRASGSKWLLVANGDTPLVSQVQLEMLISAVSSENADIALLTLNLDDSSDYGRLVRDGAGRICAVVEAKDYRPELHGPCTGEVNSGIYMFRVEALEDILFNLDRNNKQGELYITQLISLGAAYNMKIVGVAAGNCPELLGINTPGQLVVQEEFLVRKRIDHLIDKGVIIRNRQQVRIGPEVELEAGVDITGPCEIYGKSYIGQGTVIDSHCVIRSSRLSGCKVLSFSHIENSDISNDAVVGPFSRLRPGTVLERESRIGNFVEIKNSRVGQGSKASHLSYIGDTLMGNKVNVGAGTITCNYDGRKKHKTIIEDGVFIGSNSALVAPVKLKQGSLIGAGSTITMDVPEESLAVARTRQKNLPGKNPLKKN
ncbi:bifunctional UDP-N-acetylglucosamine diphosphorylase/glucosamine-1-phosphate N-acetyltransferase GlmU [Desulfonatronovibrio hydrogenovorans]|uniref:bifunctional UDP-N-acetylglucosamine diphosphorylase/glucosamine-1-phosphate N-acetyltransferase GlmU n=1 Tax=Desulfonatronovibrio hydrogenovorans TaxID=53245 RepID=UPI0012371727